MSFFVSVTTKRTSKTNWRVGRWFERNRLTYWPENDLLFLCSWWHLARILLRGILRRARTSSRPFHFVIERMKWMPCFVERDASGKSNFCRVEENFLKRETRLRGLPLFFFFFSFLLFIFFFPFPVWLFFLSLFDKIAAQYSLLCSLFHIASHNPSLWHANNIAR